MMYPRKWFIFSALATMLLVRAAGAAEFEEKRFYVTPFVGWTFFDNERQFANGRDLRNDVYLGGRAGVRLNQMLWFDVAGGYTGTKNCSECSENLVHLSGNIMWSPATLATVNPFISLGGGASQYTDATGLETNSGTFEAAAGVRVRLNDSFGLRLEARNILAVPKKNWNKSHIDDVVLGAGLTFAFGSGGEADEDGDGVPDGRDNCPNTPRGCRVDIHGCPIDSDGDGVCDGVDRCPDTPVGARVDANGCPADADGDGVHDGIDQCPDTPKGCKVDARGCPIDSDGDGVCDGIDRCADTPAGTAIDRYGCPIVQRERELEMELLDTGMIMLSNVNFDFDKSTIRPDAVALLDTVGRVLTKWPGLKLVIVGHTDSRGTTGYNQALSRRRAESVRSYLLKNFKDFEGGQLSAKAFGEVQPMLPNTTEENMAENRRVVFLALNKEILQQRKP